MSQNEAAAMIEARARRLWDDREKLFPKFTRVTWDEGSALAKDVIAGIAFDQLAGEGLIVLRDGGIYAGKPDEGGLTPMMRELVDRRDGN